MLFPIGSDEEEQTINSARQNLAKTLSQSTRIPRKKAHLPRIISIEEDPLPQLLQDYQPAQLPIQECSETLISSRSVDKETSIAVSMNTQKTGWLARVFHRIVKVLTTCELDLVTCAQHCDKDAQTVF